MNSSGHAVGGGQSGGIYDHPYYVTIMQHREISAAVAIVVILVLLYMVYGKYGHKVPLTALTVQTDATKCAYTFGGELPADVTTEWVGSKVYLRSDKDLGLIKGIWLTIKSITPPATGKSSVIVAFTESGGTACPTLAANYVFTASDYAIFPWRAFGFVGMLPDSVRNNEYVTKWLLGGLDVQ
jgi:hypothetical protein